MGNLNLDRDMKVNLAFGGFATASTILTVLYPPAGVGLMAARLIGIGAGNLLGAEAVKAGLNWLNRKREDGTTTTTATV